MTIPMYVSPEQFMKDRADYARKGIARGRSVVVLSCRQGILFVADITPDGTNAARLGAQRVRVGRRAGIRRGHRPD